MLTLATPLLVVSLYDTTLLVQLVTDVINAENSFLSNTGMLFKSEMPNSEERISGENGDTNIPKSPLTLPLTKVSTQF